MAKVTGLGGFFFKCEDPAKVREWYKEHLGIESEEWGASFEWREVDAPDRKGYTAWGPFPRTTKYFDPSESSFMVNYRVDDLEGLMSELEEAGVQVAGEIQEHENGKFGWIVDPEGVKVELWEPKDPAEDPYLD